MTTHTERVLTELLSSALQNEEKRAIALCREALVVLREYAAAFGDPRAEADIRKRALILLLRAQRNDGGANGEVRSPHHLSA